MLYRRTIKLQMMTIAFGVSLLIACGDSGSGGPPLKLCASDNALCVIPNFEEEVLRPKLEGCAGNPTAGSCHVRGTGQSTMELDVTNPATSVDAEIAALIGQNGLGGPYIDTSCTEDGYLLTRLKTTPTGVTRMPLDGDYWSNDELDCFRVYLRGTFEVPDAE